MEKSIEVKKLMNLCDELMESKILFINKKIDKILEGIATSPDVYNLLSECMSQFNKDKEFDKAFAKNTAGRRVFIMPKEEYKILALVFCLLVDIGNGKIDFDNLLSVYFTDEDGKISPKMFMEKVIIPFKNLIAEAFGENEEEEPEQEQEPLTEQQIQELPPQERLKIVPFPIERSTNYLKDPNGACLTFIAAKDTAIEMLERLGEEKQNDVTEDVTMMLHCVIIACLEQDFDLLNGLVIGLKYACKLVKPLRYMAKELEAIVQAQIKHEESK